MMKASTTVLDLLYI